MGQNLFSVALSNAGEEIKDAGGYRILAVTKVWRCPTYPKEGGIKYSMVVQHGPWGKTALVLLEFSFPIDKLCLLEKFLTSLKLVNKGSWTTMIL